MKKFVSLSLPIVMTLMLANTGNAFAEETPTNTVQDSTPIQYRGITVNKLKFDVIKDLTTLPVKMQQTVDSLKSQRGYYVFDNTDNPLDSSSVYVLICSGEKPTSGYGIVPLLLEDIEGISSVVIKELSPAPELEVSQDKTYPYTLIKFQQGTPNVIVRTEEGEKLDKIVYNIPVVTDDSSDWKSLAEKSDVEEDKEWSIRFNKEVIESSLDSNSVYVLDSNGQKVDIAVSVSDDKQTVKIKPTGTYMPGESYCLYISKNVILDTWGPLKIGYKMQFSVRTAIAIE